jgi:antitoxin component of RelBE/YafQ-DinJ toxin-antitoxin module
LYLNLRYRKKPVMATTTMVHVRVDETLKNQAAETLAAMVEAENIVRTRSARFRTAEELFDALEEETGQR